MLKTGKSGLKTLYDSRPDIKLVATGYASPVLEKGSADSGVGRWTILKNTHIVFL
jgi:predicted AAA+ superfamily ATPase